MYDDIKKRYEECASDYDGIKARTEASVVRWRWYWTGQARNPFPTWQHIRRPEEIEKPDEAQVAYGDDAEGRVVCEREYDLVYTYIHTPVHKKISHRELALEYFVGYAENFMEVLRFCTPYNYKSPKIIEHKLQEVKRVWMENGKFIATEDYRHLSGLDYHYSLELLHWEGDVLKLKQILDAKGNVDFECIPDEKGEMKLHQVLHSGERFLLGQPLPDGVTVRQLLEKARRILLERIPRAIQAARISEPIFCLVFIYEGTGNDVFYPGVSVCFESERQAWLDKGDPERWYDLWHLGGFRGFDENCLPFDDDDLTVAFDLLNTELERLADTRPAVEMLLQVAAELNKLDWSQWAPVTPDFCVVATDGELAELSQNLKNTAPKRSFEAFKADGIIE